MLQKSIISFRISDLLFCGLIIRQESLCSFWVNKLLQSKKNLYSKYLNDIHFLNYSDLH